MKQDVLICTRQRRVDSAVRDVGDKSRHEGSNTTTTGRTGCHNSDCWKVWSSLWIPYLVPHKNTNHGVRIWMCRGHTEPMIIVKERSKHKWIRGDRSTNQCFQAVCPWGNNRMHFKIKGFDLNSGLQTPDDAFAPVTDSHCSSRPSALAGCPKWSRPPALENDSLHSWSCQKPVQGRGPLKCPDCSGKSGARRKWGEEKNESWCRKRA